MYEPGLRNGSDATIWTYGRLAQLVAHHFDIVGVTGSNPVPSIFHEDDNTQAVIRAAESTDFAGIWEIFAAVVKDGDTYAYGPDTTEEQARAIWMAPGVRTYVCVADSGENQEGRSQSAEDREVRSHGSEKIVGAYLLKPQWPDLGSHICTASFIVKPGVRGGGIGSQLGKHSIDEAKRLGFKGMQFNLVVSTNEPAVRLWRKLGFSIIGTLPKAFRHKTLGFVDAYMMFLELE